MVVILFVDPFVLIIFQLNHSEWTRKLQQGPWVKWVSSFLTSLCKVLTSRLIVDSQQMHNLETKTRQIVAEMLLSMNDRVV